MACTISQTKLESIFLILLFSIIFLSFRLAVGTRRGVLVCSLTPDPNSWSPELCVHQVMIENDPEVNASQREAAAFDKVSSEKDFALLRVVSSIFYIFYNTES